MSPPNDAAKARESGGRDRGGDAPSTGAVLPDLLAPHLRVIFCGSAVGKASARARAYYAGPGNRFYRTLHEIGLTPRLFTPADYRELLTHGIGLTDIAKLRAGSDKTLRAADFDAAGLRARIEEYKPRAVAFNGKRAASAYFGPKLRGLDYGRQRETIGHVPAFILPSTSAAARAHWGIEPWQALAEFVTKKPRPG